jgi:tetratricopeptide (TPR) repeat protein
MTTKSFRSLCLALLILFLQIGSVWSGSLADDAREAIRLEKYDRALKLLNDALTENPLSTNAHLLMVEYYLALQDYGAAELSTERPLVLNRGYAPLVAQAYYVAAERAMRRSQLPQALALYETAVAIDPAVKSKVKGKYMAIGNDLLTRGMIAKALSAYTQEVGINPAARKSVADTVFARGQALLGINDKGAETLFSFAVSLDFSYGPKAARAKEEAARLSTREEAARLLPREEAARLLPAEDHLSGLSGRAPAATGNEPRQPKDEEQGAAP